MNLLTANKFARVSNAAALGTNEVASDIVDTSGLSDVSFVVALGATTGNGVVVLQQSATNDANTFTNAAGSSYAFTNAATNALVLVEAIDPQYRYQRVVVTRTTNTIVDGIVVIQGKSNLEPITQPATVASTTILASPPNS